MRKLPKGRAKCRVRRKSSKHREQVSQRKAEKTSLGQPPVSTAIAIAPSDDHPGAQGERCVHDDCHSQIDRSPIELTASKSETGINSNE